MTFLPKVEPVQLWDASIIAQRVRNFLSITGASWDNLYPNIIRVCNELGIPDEYSTEQLFAEVREFLSAPGLKRIGWLPFPHLPRQPPQHPRLLDKPSPEMQAEMERLRREDPELYGEPTSRDPLDPGFWEKFFKDRRRYFEYLHMVRARNGDPDD